MQLGEQIFTVLEAGRKYRLSDGTELSFQTRNGDGVVGVTAEEVMTVLKDRLSALRQMNAGGARSISLAITDLESAENWIARWDADRRRERRRSMELIREQRGIEVKEELTPA